MNTKLQDHNSLTVNEIFHSIQGEGSRAGLPCTMIRLTGCNLRCSWCDTAYAFDAGEEMTIDEIIDRAHQLGCDLVEVTGGEPLCQQLCLELLSRLADEFGQVMLETNGSLEIGDVDQRVIRIVDFKCPSSNQDQHNLWSNVKELRKNDEVKFVLTGRNDFDFACNALADHHLTEKCQVIFSPVTGLLDPANLAQWILELSLPVRMGLQLHKIIWPNQDRGV